MSRMSKNPIQDNFVILCNKLNLERLLPYLRQERMITIDEYEILTNPNLTTKAKREKLLIWLPKKGRNYFVNFGKCLVWSGQTELARHIGVDVAMVPEPPVQLPAEPSPEDQQQQMFNMLRSMMQQTPTTRTPTATPQPHSLPPSAAPSLSVSPSVLPSTVHPSSSLPAVTFSTSGAHIPSSIAYPPSANTGPHVHFSGGSNHANSSPFSNIPPQPSSAQALPSEPMDLGGTVPLQHLRQDVPTKGGVFILYCKDNLPEKVSEAFCDDIVDLADVLRHCGFNCMVDHYVGEHPANWNLWTEQMIRESQYVLLVYSPTLAERMKSPLDHTLNMAKGKYYANMIVNLVHPPKFIPVYLNNYVPNIPANHDWLPSQIRMTTVYHVNIAQLGQAIQVPEGTPEHVFRAKLQAALHEARFREIANLVYHLLKESDTVPPVPAQNPVKVPAFHPPHVLHYPPSGHPQPYATGQVAQPVSSNFSHVPGNPVPYGVQPQSAQLMQNVQLTQQPQNVPHHHPQDGLPPLPAVGPNDQLPTQAQETLDAYHITDDDVRRLGLRLKYNWYNLGMKLGVDSAELDAVQKSLARPTEYEEAMAKVVRLWKRTKREGATRAVLKQALIDIQYGKVALELFRDD